MADSASSSPERSCFVARPISITEAAAALYGGDLLHWQHVEESLILPALEETGYRHIPTPARGAGLIHAHVIEAVNGADLVIADFSQLNPNVFFEAGVRTAVNKPLLVIAEKGTRLPFDTMGINTWFYDARLQHWDIDAMVVDLAQHIEDTNTEGNELWNRFGVRLQAQEFTTTSSIDPTAAAIKQISLDLQDLRQSQADLERGLLSPGGLDLAALPPRMNEMDSVAQAVEGLIEGLRTAGKSVDVINEVDRRCRTLLRKDIVLGSAGHRQSLQDDLGKLLEPVSTRDTRLDFLHFTLLYDIYVTSARREAIEMRS